MEGIYPTQESVGSFSQSKWFNWQEKIWKWSPFILNALKEIEKDFGWSISFFRKNWRGLVLAYLFFFTSNILAELLSKAWLNYQILKNQPPSEAWSLISLVVFALSQAFLLLPLFYIFHRVKGFYARLRMHFFWRALKDFFLPGVLLFLFLNLLTYLLYLPSNPLLRMHSFGLMQIWFLLMSFVIFPFYACAPFLLLVEKGYVIQTAKRLWAFILQHYAFLLVFGLLTGMVVCLSWSGLKWGVKMALLLLFPSLKISPPAGFVVWAFLGIWPLDPTAPLFLHQAVGGHLLSLPFPSRLNPPVVESLARLVAGSAGIFIFFIYSAMVCRIILRRLTPR